MADIRAAKAWSDIFAAFSSWTFWFAAACCEPSPCQTKVAFISSFNADYARIHESYENNFWETKMNLEGNSTDALTKSFNELEAFLGDQSALETTRKLLTNTDGSVTEDQRVILRQIE